MESSAHNYASAHETIESLLLNQIAEEKRLFHYTDAAGLMGMAQYQQMWMTNMHYQNDKDEYYYTFNLLKKILREEYKGFLSEEALSNMGNTVSGTFTFSLSEKSDSLSQWRGYCPDGGFAISFDNKQLNTVIQKNGMYVVECIYDVNRQRQLIIDNIIGITPEEYREATEPKTGSPSGLGHIENRFNSWGIVHSLNKLAAILKHPSFSDEKEWRLIKSLDTDYRGAFGTNELFDIVRRNRYSQRKDVNIRASRNKLIPYMEISLQDGEKPIRFSEVVVSPTPHKIRELSACKTLINRYDADYKYEPHVRSSDIPYVNW